MRACWLRRSSRGVEHRRPARGGGHLCEQRTGPISQWRSVRPWLCDPSQGLVRVNLGIVDMFDDALTVSTGRTTTLSDNCSRIDRSAVALLRMFTSKVMQAAALVHIRYEIRLVSESPFDERDDYSICLTCEVNNHVDLGRASGPRRQSWEPALTHRWAPVQCNRRHRRERGLYAGAQGRQATGISPFTKRGIVIGHFPGLEPQHIQLGGDRLLCWIFTAHSRPESGRVML